MPYTPSGVPFVNRDASQAAAESQAAKAPADRLRVERYLRYLYPEGATVDELEVALDMLHQTASARARDLVTDGVVERTDGRRATRTGRTAAVLRYVPEGLRGEPKSRALPWD